MQTTFISAHDRCWPTERRQGYSTGDINLVDSNLTSCCYMPSMSACLSVSVSSVSTGCPHPLTSCCSPLCPASFQSPCSCGWTSSGSCARTASLWTRSLAPCLPRSPARPSRCRSTACPCRPSSGLACPPTSPRLLPTLRPGTSHAPCWRPPGRYSLRSCPETLAPPLPHPRYAPLRPVRHG